MNKYIKFIIFLLSGFGFYLLTGDLSEGILLIILLSYIEFHNSKN